MAGSLKDSVCATLCSGHDSLKCRTCAYEALRNVELRRIHVEIVFCVCDCRFQKFVTMGQSTISIRVDEKLKKSFDELCDSVGLSNTAAFTVFMKAAVRERRIPFELRAETEAEIRAKSMEAFEEMRRIA